METSRTLILALLIGLALGALVLAATTVATAVAAPALGSTIRYVATTGNDGANACASPSSPCRTIQ